jgi:hypothetical protein
MACQVGYACCASKKIQNKNGDSTFNHTFFWLAHAWNNALHN